MRRRALACWLAVPFAIAAGAILLPEPSIAQIQLPGAVRGPSQTGPVAPPGGKPAGGARREDAGPADPGNPVLVKAPNERTLAGKVLMHNGSRGAMRFVSEGGTIRLQSLKLQGDVISRVGESCEIEVPGAPFTVVQAGRDDGLLKFRVQSQSCPFEISVLDGAVLVAHNGARASTGLGVGTCEFKEKDCRGYLAGIWGPSGRSIGKNEAAGIEKVRGAADRHARTNFRVLPRRAGRDKPKIKEIASDQAGFSARREETCRDYLREHQHGFCASRITLARAVSLAAQMGAVEIEAGDSTVDPGAKPKPRPRPRPRPAEPSAAMPPSGFPPLR